MEKIHSVFVNAKCSDLCFITFKDKNGNEIGERDGYVPDWMPEDHYGDYIEIEIEVETCRILNWKKPTQSELVESKKTPYWCLSKFVI